jgi:environmental stress-induced protein Ves
MASPSPQSSFVVRAGGQARMRWKNGAGWTSESLRVPDRDDWDWRLSVAEIDADAPFSAFPGVERELVLLSGNGLRLRFDDGEVRKLLPPHDRLRFAGERAAFGELLDGPTRDFNLMWRRDAVDAALWLRPLVGSMVVFVAPGETWALHLVAGHAHLGGDAPCTLAAGDTAILRAADGRGRHPVDGAGTALLVRVAPRPAG